MIRLKNLFGREGWLALLLTFVLVVLSQGLDLRKSWAEGGNWKNVTLIYSTDIKGKIEPCG
ncbi:MAG: hypothetical protein KOO60_07040 [Gemmatimonadales bacterium]|nr:hypothetical protein [Gemmatimonadales bacterium]